MVTDGHALAGFGEYRQQPGTLRASGGDIGGGSEVLVVQDDDVVRHALSGHNQRNDPDGEHFVVQALSENQHGELRLTPCSSPVSAGGGKPGQGYPVVFNWQSGGDVRLNISSEHTSAMQASQTPAVLTGMGVRRLTVTECERLQGFPDNFTAVDGVSDTARYKMLGNAVAVPKAKWIGRQILGVA